MQVHDIKIRKKYFDDVIAKGKNFEIRYNDRNYQKGDLVIMREYEDDYYTGNYVICEIEYVLDNVDGLDEGYCVFSFEKLTSKAVATYEF